MTAPLASQRLERLGPAAHAFRRLRGTHRLLLFLLVGGLNTAVGYGLFVAALAILPTAFVALCVSTVLAVLINFMTTGSFVFHSRDLRRLLGFVLVCGLVFAYNAIGPAAFQLVSVGPRVAALLLPGVVAISYLCNSRYTFARS